jgi:hypothetical protein
MRRQIKIADFLTVKEAVKAAKLYNEAEPGSFARRCAAEIIEPVMPRINRKLGQENHPLYLAYLVEYIFLQTEAKERIQTNERGNNNNIGSAATNQS